MKLCLIVPQGHGEELTSIKHCRRNPCRPPGTEHAIFRLSRAVQTGFVGPLEPHLERVPVQAEPDVERVNETCSRLAGWIGRAAFSFAQPGVS
jgi:hypothetical protein